MMRDDWKLGMRVFRTQPGCRSVRWNGCGFTLVELVITLAIIAMLSSIAAFSMTGTLHQYHLTRATETLERFDQTARRIARSTETQTLTTIYRTKGKLTIEIPGARHPKTYTIPRRVEISSVRLPGKTVAGNRFDQTYNIDGRTQVYAVELSIGSMKQWVVFLGNSGQSLSISNERRVNELLSL